MNEMNVLGILGGDKRFKQVYSVYDIIGVCLTITTAASHGNGIPYILVNNGNKETEYDK